MITQFTNKFKFLINNHWYWSALIFVGVSLLSVALFYQHVLDELPCIVCIQIRLWVAALIIVAIIALVVRRVKILNLITHVLTVGIAVALTERSYLLLGTERGFIFGDCGFFLGLPDWFAIEAWLPWLFQVETSCGYTPEIIFGITMAEALMVFSVGFLLLAASILLSVLVNFRRIDSNR